MIWTTSIVYLCSAHFISFSDFLVDVRRVVGRLNDTRTDDVLIDSIRFNSDDFIESKDTIWFDRECSSVVSCMCGVLLARITETKYTLSIQDVGSKGCDPAAEKNHLFLSLPPLPSRQHHMLVMLCCCFCNPLTREESEHTKRAKKSKTGSKWIANKQHMNDDEKAIDWWRTRKGSSSSHESAHKPSNDTDAIWRLDEIE